MASLQQRKTLIGNTLLHDKVRVAAYDYAAYVLNDVNRANEHPYFQNIINNPSGWKVEPLVWDVVANADIQEKMINNPTAYSENDLDVNIKYVVEVSIVKYSVPPAAPAE